MFMRYLATTLFWLLIASTGAFAASSDLPIGERFVYKNTSQDVVNLKFEDEAGIAHKLSDFQGRYVLLNVWATWCRPCIKEMPSLNALQAKLDPKKIALIALAEDRMGKTVVPAFYKRHELQNLKPYLDVDGSALTQLKLRGLPTTLLFNPEGIEIGRIEDGVDWIHPTTVSFLEERISKTSLKP